MKVEEAYQFIFHPWSEEHSLETKIAATIADIALTVFSFGLFLFPFLYYQWQDRDVTVINQSTSASKKADEVLKSPVSSPKASVRKTGSTTNSQLSSKARAVKEKQAGQLKQFEQWAAAGQWGHIHRAHYDWWMYPVNYSSRTTGSTYQLNANEVDELKADPEFMQNYKRGVVLGAQAWGWDVLNSKPIEKPTSDQKWQNWDVRLGKMIDSLNLFNESDLVASMRRYARQNSIPVYN